MDIVLWNNISVMILSFVTKVFVHSFWICKGLNYLCMYYVTGLYFNMLDHN